MFTCEWCCRETFWAVVNCQGKFHILLSKDPTSFGPAESCLSVTLLLKSALSHPSQMQALSSPGWLGSYQLFFSPVLLNDTPTFPTKCAWLKASPFCYPWTIHLFLNHSLEAWKGFIRGDVWEDWIAQYL